MTGRGARLGGTLGLLNGSQHFGFAAETLPQHPGRKNLFRDDDGHRGEERQQFAEDARLGDDRPEQHEAIPDRKHQQPGPELRVTDPAAIHKQEGPQEPEGAGKLRPVA